MYFLKFGTTLKNQNNTLKIKCYFGKIGMEEHEIYFL